ncbi:MAG: hypothetical protein LBV50_12305 [Novosphingobium sp.]|jgi:hypothetical protein|nr:hypothetical protein [Novosphingobium sp.]
MDRDLFLAILAMDSYNRGYGAGIKDLPVSGKIGNATILDIPLPEGSEAVGFYAIAYKNIDTGEVVIAYRGTDNPGFSADKGTGGSDPLNGYGLALGYTPDVQDATFGVDQLRLARRGGRRLRAVLPVRHERG